MSSKTAAINVTIPEETTLLITKKSHIEMYGYVKEYQNLILKKNDVDIPGTKSKKEMKLNNLKHKIARNYYFILGNDITMKEIKWMWNSNFFKLKTKKRHNNNDNNQNNILSPINNVDKTFNEVLYILNNKRKYIKTWKKIFKESKNTDTNNDNFEHLKIKNFKILNELDTIIKNVQKNT